ncbi:phosphorylase superfamily protein [Colletotrichum musicola]|uniref:Phosphorylase superfamily protein n=1 Tax=Colletotrichum musicola TaxID=2175873 RepID=A0A8H6JCH6_9PEZI|nr:phosphorylase superfamily protein [Colletotrichum musicola]
MVLRLSFAGELIRRGHQPRQTVMKPSSPSFSELLNAGTENYKQKKFTEAEIPLRKAVKLLEKAKGRDHRRTLATKFTLGLTLFELAEYERSELILKDVAGRYKSTSGADNEKTITSNLWLARIYFQREKYGQAEKLFQEMERFTTLDTYDDTGINLLCWGRACLKQEKFAKAERILRKATERAERRLEQGHEQTIKSHYWLGYAHFKQNKYSDAEKRFRKVVKSGKGASGTDDEHWLDANYGLGCALHQQGRWDEAEEPLQISTDGYERTRGWGHLDTLKGHHWLGRTLCGQYKFTLAERSLRKAAEGFQRTQGGDHHYTIESHHWLGRTLHSMNRWGEAEGSLRKAEAGIEKCLGANATPTLLNKHLLALSMLYLKKNAAEAEQLLKSSAAGLERDADFFTVCTGKFSLGVALHRQQKYAEGEQLFKEAAEGFRVEYGRYDPWTIRSYFRLGESFYHQEKYREAEPPLQEAAELSTRTLGTHDDGTLEVTRLLAEVQERLSPTASAEATETVAPPPEPTPTAESDQQPRTSAGTKDLPVRPKRTTYRPRPEPRGSFREDYTVGWICALPIELAAAEEILDDEHGEFRREREDNDENLYVLGSIGKHKTVVVCLPAGRIGSNPAAAVATQMMSTFRNIRLVLMVGIGGGVPSAEADVRLGDVVVGHPHSIHGGVVQYDMGKTTPSGFARTGMLNMPPPMLLAAVARVRANEFRGRSKFHDHLSKLEDVARFQRARAGHDILFQATYDHAGHQTCDGCRPDKQVTRPQRESTEEVAVHYGTIASGNQVMRTATERDRVSKELGGVLCFEMEGAGLMNNSACLMVRGICDYSDSHKNKSWQAYAAGTAAAWAKELLSVIPAADEA